MELLEREDVLRDLRRHLEWAKRGHGALVLVHGEAGIGKTAVVRRFAAEAGGRVRVLFSACDPLSTPRPLGPLGDIAPLLQPQAAETAQAIGAVLGGTADVDAGAGAVFRGLLDALPQHALYQGGRATLL